MVSAVQPPSCSPSSCTRRRLDCASCIHLRLDFLFFLAICPTASRCSIFDPGASRYRVGLPHGTGGSPREQVHRWLVQHFDPAPWPGHALGTTASACWCGTGPFAGILPAASRSAVLAGRCAAHLERGNCLWTRGSGSRRGRARENRMARGGGESVRGARGWKIVAPVRRSSGQARNTPLWAGISPVNRETALEARRHGGAAPPPRGQALM